MTVTEIVNKLHASVSNFNDFIYQLMADRSFTMYLIDNTIWAMLDSNGVDSFVTLLEEVMTRKKLISSEEIESCRQMLTDEYYESLDEEDVFCMDEDKRINLIHKYIELMENSYIPVSDVWDILTNHYDVLTAMIDITYIKSLMFLLDLEEICDPALFSEFVEILKN